MTNYSDAVVRVKLKTKVKNNKPTKEKVMEQLYNGVNLPLVRIIEQTDSFVVILRNSDDVNKLMSDEAKNSLNQINLEAVDHPKLKAQRTLIFKRIDPHIGKRSAIEIENEIREKYDWVQIRQVIKIRDFTHMFKIEFNDAKTSEKIRNDGLLIFNMAITPSQIEVESYIDIKMCFKCYALESHTTNQCPAPNKLVCSECSATDHYFKDCESSFKKCVNCAGSHRTTSMACPKRKDIVALKTKNSFVTQGQTYASTVSHGGKMGIPYPLTGTNHINFDPKMGFEIMTCIIHAHIINMGCPGSYNTTLKDMFKRNNLPEMEFPSDPPSSQIIGATASAAVILNTAENTGLITEKTNEIETNLSEQNGRSTKRRRNEEMEIQHDQGADVATSIQQNKYTTEDLQITVYTTKANKPNNSEQLKTALLQNRARWKSNRTDITPEILHDIVTSDRLILTPNSIEVVPHKELQNKQLQSTYNSSQ